MRHGKRAAPVVETLATAGTDNISGRPMSAFRIAQAFADSSRQLADVEHQHRILRPMFAVVERLFETDPATALPLLASLATLNGSRTFRDALDEVAT